MSGPQLPVGIVEREDGGSMSRRNCGNHNDECVDNRLRTCSRVASTVFRCSRRDCSCRSVGVMMGFLVLSREYGLVVDA